MSNKPSPGTLIEEDDPVALKALLRLRRSEFSLRAEAYERQEALSDSENAAEQMLFDMETARLVNEQIGLVMKIRGVTTAPKRAPKGTKQPKAAPIDLSNLEADIMNIG